MNETIEVQVDQGQGYVVADAELSVVGEWCRGPLQEPGQTLITEFHEKNRQVGLRVLAGAQVLDNIGVPG